MTEFSLLSAFVVGILGAGHCLSMCGGIMASFALTIPNYQHFSWLQKLPYLAAYNIGRIISYTMAGALVAGSSQLLKHSLGIKPEYLQIFSSVMLLLMGLYVANLSGLLGKVESLGKGLWHYLQPLTKRFLPLKSAWLALPFGFIWGWLPCGLVYSMLTWSLASGQWQIGASQMLFFGLGTLPSLLLAGSLATQFKALIQQAKLRLAMGILLIIYAQWLLVMAIVQLIG